MQWYKIEGFQGHVGTGKSQEITLYVKAKDITQTIKKYQRVPSIKKNLNGKGVFPNISEVENQIELEEIIKNDSRVKNKQKCWFYFPLS